MPAHCSSKPALSDDVPSWRVNAAHMSAHPYVALWWTGLERKGGISGFPYLQSYANVHNAQEVISCDTTPSDAFTAGLLAALAFRQHRAVADSAAALCSCCKQWGTDCSEATHYTQGPQQRVHAQVHVCIHVHAQVEDALYSLVEPTPTGTEPYLVAYSKGTAALLELDTQECERPEFPLLFSGSAPLPGRYAGRR